MILFSDRKRVRAYVVRDYVERARLDGCVCFSCGNASRALMDAGVYVVEVAPGGDLEPGRWWMPHEIARAWPGLLDATSGHLPMGLLPELARAYREHLGELQPGFHGLPTGSGETLVALSMAYPECRFVPVYNVGKGTAHSPLAPLNGLVEALVRLHGMGAAPTDQATVVK